MKLSLGRVSGLLLLLILVSAGTALLFIKYFKRLFNILIILYTSDIFNLNMLRACFVILNRLRMLILGSVLLGKILRSGVFLFLLIIYLRSFRLLLLLLCNLNWLGRFLSVVSLFGLGCRVLLGIFIWLGMKTFHEVV